MRVNYHGPLGGTAGVPGGMVHAVRQLREVGVEQPVVLGVAPAYANNPFQEVLVRGCWDQGVAPVAIPRVQDVAQLGIAQRLGASTILHVHWTNQLQDDEREVTAQLHGEFRAAVEELKAGGGRLVWTIHNRLPHECPHPDLEVQLRRWLVEHADVVHVMGGSTAAAVADLYPLDEARVVEVPHPSYTGVYPDTVDRPHARWELGLAPDEEVLLVFGGIRPYKNVALALDALDRLLEHGRRARLLVAGRLMGSWEGRDELEERLVMHPATSVHLGRVEEVDVQRFFKAADVLLLPYTTIINSGVLLLGATFGLPTVATGEGEVGEVVRSAGLGTTFDGGAEELADAATEVLDGDRAAMAAAAAVMADQVRPEDVAARYRRDVLQLGVTGRST